MMKPSTPMNRLLLALLMGALLFAGRLVFAQVTPTASETPPGDGASIKGYVRDTCNFRPQGSQSRKVDLP